MTGGNKCDICGYSMTLADDQGCYTEVSDSDPFVCELCEKYAIKKDEQEDA